MVPREEQARVRHPESSVMILRAAFFIGLVWLLAPHEPDLGLGRPDVGKWLPSASGLLSAAGLGHGGQSEGGQFDAGRLCDDCSLRLGALAHMPRISVDWAPLHGRSLGDVKAEIDAAVAARRAKAS
jgi:hypothetical protein